MKKISVFVLAFMMSLLVFGCEEVENKDIIEKGKNIETSLVEKVDLSAIKTPEEASVYSALYFDRKPKEVARIFLGNDFKEGETSAMGRMFVSDAGTKNEKLLYALDDGKAYFGESQMSGYNGINYGMYNKTRKIWDSIEEGNITGDYSLIGRIPDEAPDWQDDKDFLDKQKLISAYLEKLGVDGYELYHGKKFNVKKENCCLMYFKQTADGIPVSHILFSNAGTRGVYNYRHSVVDEEVISMDADLRMIFLKDELIDFYCSPMINVGSQIKKYPIVSVDKAYEAVKKHYPVSAGTDVNYELTDAKLQYELIALDDTNGHGSSTGKLYLYPVWIFGVYSKDEEDLDTWEYYIVDAVSGEFFSNIPKEVLQ